MLCKISPVSLATVAVVWSSELGTSHARALHSEVGMEALSQVFNTDFSSAPSPAIVGPLSESPESAILPGVHAAHARPAVSSSVYKVPFKFRHIHGQYCLPLSLPTADVCPAAMWPAMSMRRNAMGPRQLAHMFMHAYTYLLSIGALYASLAVNLMSGSRGGAPTHSPAASWPVRSHTLP